jgi:hypothetical protein
LFSGWSEYWKHPDLAVANYHNIGLSVWRFLCNPAVGWLQSKEISYLANTDYGSAKVTSDSEFVNFRYKLYGNVDGQSVAR